MPPLLAVQFTGHFGPGLVVWWEAGAIVSLAVVLAAAAGLFFVFAAFVPVHTGQ